MNHNPSESQIQESICEYFSIICQRRKFIYFSVPNESLSPRNGKKLSGPEYGRVNKLKKIGLLSGVSDLAIVHLGLVYFMEVKKPKGKLSEPQKLFRQNALNAGAEYAVVRSVDEARACLEVWGIL